MFVMFFISIELESWMSRILSDLFLVLFQKSQQQVFDFGIFFALNDQLYFYRYNLIDRALKEFLESKSLTILKYLVVINQQKPYYLQERGITIPFCMVQASIGFQSSISSNQQLNSIGCYGFLLAYLVINLFKSSSSFDRALLWQLKKNQAYFSLISNKNLLFLELSSLLASQIVLLLIPKQLSMGNSLNALSPSLYVIKEMNCLTFFDSANFSIQEFLSACRKALVYVISAILVEKVFSLR